ncbi:MAG: HIRAN domain-containing protein [Oscillospiraceae bacterium]|nr:HIRAN domain-containing protein [Oscillospiraceae bacterium]
MVQAWITVKLRRIDTKTAGVTHGNRQKLLARLSRYSPDEITIKLQREQDNAADKNAVQVIAAVKGKGAAVMGYLNRQLAAAIAPLMDKGKAVASSFRAITGGADYCLSYGLNISIAV